MNGNELYLSKGYYKLCLAIIKQANTDKEMNKYQYECEDFFNNSYVFKLCENYIKLYRNREINLYSFKPDFLRGKKC